MADTTDPVDQIFAAQKAKVVARRTSFDYAARAKALGDFEAMVLANQNAIRNAIHRDFGKHADEVTLTEIIPLLLEIRQTRKHLRRWMRPTRAAPGLAFLGTSATVRPTPKGVALVIAPWNFPILLALGPLVSALAAGCSVILKPSELTPATTALINRMLTEAFPADLIAVVEGGVETATALLEFPFDHIFFTGSPQVGKIVMAAASKTLATVTLELGGKSPVIVGPDADIQDAARWIAWGSFLNGGQACISTDHVYVHISVQAAFNEAMTANIAKMYGADPMGSKDLSRMAHPRQWVRVAGLLADARAKGATILTGGQTDEASQKIAPTILLDLRDDMDIQSEEVFGPVLPVMPYSDLDDVIARINAAPHPLSLYIFGSNSFADGIIAQTQSGAVGVNLTAMLFAHPTAPFGGVGHSGNGGTHGYAGFAAFSHMRQVLRQRYFPLHLVFPPFTGSKRRLLKVFQRIVRF